MPGPALPNARKYKSTLHFVCCAALRFSNVTPITATQPLRLRNYRVRSTVMSAVVVPIVPAIQLKRILHSTDLSSAARAALPIVSTIARIFKSQVYVAYIWAPLPYTMVTPEAASMLETGQEH